MYTNPPDSNNPLIDHGLDEDEIWAFRLSSLNQPVVVNQYTNSIFAATRKAHVPFWGQKLFAPAFFKEEKWTKYLDQWNTRIGLEEIKMRQAFELNTHVRSKQMVERHQTEIRNYV